jgi:hypothetical protein
MSFCVNSYLFLGHIIITNYTIFMFLFMSAAHFVCINWMQRNLTLLLFLFVENQNASCGLECTLDSILP